MEKLRIGMAGAGNIAQSAHLPAYKERNDVEVVAICDLNLERAQAAAAKFGIPHYYGSIDEMLAQPDIQAVDICVWNGSHKQIAVAAANAGKHILCEKPMALNVEHALEMKAAVEKAGVRFMMAMPSRYNSDTRLLKEMIDDGKLGDIYYAKTGYVRRRGTPKGWFTDTTKSGGGPVIDIGVHCIDRTWFLMGRPKPVRVSASISKRIGDYQTKGVSRWIALDSDVTAFDTEDSAAGVFHFENGATMLFEVSWALNAKAIGEYTEVCGTKAGAELNPLTVYGEDMGYLTDNVLTTEKVNPFYVEIGEFVKCVQEDCQPEGGLEDGLTIMKMLMGIYESAAKGCEIELN